jgi:hypothetical protein
MITPSDPVPTSHTRGPPMSPRPLAPQETGENMKM